MFIKKRIELKSKNLKLILEWPRLSVLRFFMVFCVRAPTVDVGYVPNAKYLAHIPHQTQKIAL